MQYNDISRLLSYDADSGVFINLVSRGGLKSGEVAGAKSKTGYITLSINAKRVYAHRVAWLLFYGEEPDKHIDHINCIRDDNRIINLRLATDKQNLQNLKNSHIDNKTGFLGVSKISDSIYRSRIYVDNRTINIGCFKTAEEAHEAYIKAKILYHPFFDKG